ncbi:MAG TPA: aspartate--tRNA ligase [Acidimicrobiales bacterium]|nr:aspartate--tRNA ligase [Acidimicrobiales bacterium]
MTLRTDYCGELGSGDVGRQVSVCGWVASRREHSEHLAFVDLRDHTGVVQCVVDHAHDLRSEYVLRITGTVRPRPEGTVNPNLPTGEIELHDCGVEVLSTAEPPPFPVTDRTDADETVRLKYRYVDLRRPRMQRNLRLRATVNSAIRRSFEAQGFVEIETPLLMVSTPEGSRDFVVPSRLKQGSFYALPQSPQLFKQLLMVGGADRYFQIARLARDEDLRADRQLEFTQLDAEASFVDQDDVIAFISVAVAAATEAATGTRPSLPIPTITWEEAAERFGSDKPDVRFGMELVELTPVFAATEAKAFQAPCIKGILVEGQGDISRNRLDALTDMAKRFGAKGLAWFRVRDAELEGQLTRFLSEDEQTNMREAMGANPGDLILAVADERRLVREVLGRLRLELGKPPVFEGDLHYIWVVDFPLFEGLDDAGRPIPAHHPFTMPHPDDIEKLESDPLSVRSQAYDLVLNGWELGSGSVRIHRADIQQRVFSLLGIDPEEAQARFGFLLDAFRYGAPPHAGFAFGIDRLAAILAGEDNIREVIAFPKTQSGADPLTGAPAPIDQKQLDELGLRVLPPKS